MRTFLLTWNPKKFNWEEVGENLDEKIDEIKTIGFTSFKWTVLSHKQVKHNDRVFLMVLGQEPKGIIGYGSVISKKPREGKHWRIEHKKVYRVEVRMDVLINPTLKPLLSLSELNRGKLSNINWTPRFSGMEIKPEFLDELEVLWSDFRQKNNL